MSKFLIRRARPYVAGFFYDDWEYRFAPEFALSSPNAQTYQTTIADAMKARKARKEMNGLKAQKDQKVIHNYIDNFVNDTINKGIESGVKTI